MALGLLLHRIYEVYSDYVLKNPFYEVEQVGCLCRGLLVPLVCQESSISWQIPLSMAQVIKCELFDEHLEAAVRRHSLL